MKKLISLAVLVSVLVWGVALGGDEGTDATLTAEKMWDRHGKVIYEAKEDKVWDVMDAGESTAAIPTLTFSDGNTLKEEPKYQITITINHNAVEATKAIGLVESILAQHGDAYKVEVNISKVQEQEDIILGDNNVRTPDNYGITRRTFETKDGSNLLFMEKPK